MRYVNTLSAILVALMIIPVWGQSETDTTFNFIRGTYQAGQVLQTNDFVAGTNTSGNPIDYFQSLRLEYGVQTKGKYLWERIYNYPFYGVGFYAANFFNRDELGTPSAIYGYMVGPLKRWSEWTLNWELGFGLTYNWKPFDPEFNPYNIAIGSRQTVYIDAGLNVSYPIAQRWDLAFGFSFTHFSNGATAVPNFGINLMAPRIEAKYYFQRERVKFIREEIPEYKDNWEWILVGALGVKQVEFDTADTGLPTRYVPVDYGIATISTGIYRQFAHTSKAGAGIDFSYDGSVNAQIDINEDRVERADVPFNEKISLGVHVGYEQVFGRLSIIVQLGHYILRKEIENQTPDAYQRAGIKYHVWDDISFGINIRAFDYGVADFIEWNMGYRMQWW